MQLFHWKHLSKWVFSSYVRFFNRISAIFSGLLHIPVKDWVSSHNRLLQPYKILYLDKWTMYDLNLRPSGYEPDALTNWAKGP